MRQPADRHEVAPVPFCAYENAVEIHENGGDWTATLFEIRSELCLFVPTKISAVVRKFLKRLGVPDGI